MKTLMIVLVVALVAGIALIVARKPEKFWDAVDRNVLIRLVMYVGWAVFGVIVFEVAIGSPMRDLQTDLAVYRAVGETIKGPYSALSVLWSVRSGDTNKVVRDLECQMDKVTLSIWATLPRKHGEERRQMLLDLWAIKEYRDAFPWNANPKVTRILDGLTSSGADHQQEVH